MASKNLCFRTALLLVAVICVTAADDSSNSTQENGNLLSWDPILDMNREMKNIFPENSNKLNKLKETEMEKPEKRAYNHLVQCRENPKWNTINAGDSVVIESPRKPGATNYMRKKKCGWKFRGATKDTRLTVSCTNFNMAPPSPAGRCTDFLRVEKHRFCGEDQVNVTASKRGLNIRFSSNRRVTRPGFVCTVEPFTPVIPIIPPSPGIQCGALILPSHRIVGGFEVFPNILPWVVAFSDNEDLTGLLCGGSLINKRWILTAAHCLLSISNKVILGGHTVTPPLESQVVASISKIVKHPQYHSETYDNDIALVKLQEEVPFEIRNTYAGTPVCLPDVGESFTDYVGVKNAAVYGWGTLEYDTNNYTNELQGVVVSISSESDCLMDYENYTITDNMFCAGYDQGGADFCQGDSGGPLIVWYSASNRYIATIHKQIGIASWGVGCGSEHHRGVYTKLTNYIDWIDENMDGYGHYLV